MMCDKCDLEGPTPVKGRGNRESPPLMFIGEAPGKTEDTQGKPFVGPSGRIVNHVLEFVGINPEDCYFTNVCLCKPLDNRTPTADEVKCCWPRLQKEIQEINPQMIIALGATAGRTLFPGFRGVQVSQGHIMRTRTGHTGVLTIHPAALLYPKQDVLYPTFLRDLKKIAKILDGTFKVQDHQTKVISVLTDKLAKKVIKRIKEVDDLSYDWETTGLDPNVDEGFCLGMSWKPGTAVVWPVDMVRKWAEPLSEALEQVPNLIAYNAVFDAKFNEAEGLPPLFTEDPMLMHYALDERPQRRSLENLADDYLGAPRYEQEMLAKYKATKGNMTEKIPADVIANYCGKDADYALRLYHLFDEDLEKTHSLAEMYARRLIPQAGAIMDIQQHGIWIDQDLLEEITETMEQQQADFTTNMRGHLVALIEELSDKEISKIKWGGGDKPGSKSLSKLTDRKKLLKWANNYNPNSHPQTHFAVWDVFKFREPRIWGRDPRSVDSDTRDVLLEVYPHHPFIETLHEYKTMFTLLSRYIRKLPAFIYEDGRVRPHFHQDRTETGRLSATDPPVHQWPRDPKMRRIFAAPPGKVIIKADYSQVEMRIAAHVAKDEGLKQILENEDFHSAMAARAYRIPISDVTPEQRQAAKSVSFGLLYLMGDRKLAEGTGLPHREAVRFVYDYKASMPKVQQWIEDRKADVRGQKYVESLFGRRRRFPFITNDNLASLQREAVNMPIQSAASEMTVDAAVRIHWRLKDKYPDAFIIILMHDEVVVEAPEEQADEVAKLIEEEMVRIPFKSKVKFPVEVNVAKTWGGD